MLSAVSDFAIDNIIEKINEIYDSGEILDDLSKFIFETLPKKQVQMNVNSIRQSS